MNEYSTQGDSIVANDDLATFIKYWLDRRVSLELFGKWHDGTVETVHPFGRILVVRLDDEIDDKVVRVTLGYQHVKVLPP